MGHKAKKKARTKKTRKEKKEKKQARWPEAERPYRMFDLDLNPKKFVRSHEELLNAIEALFLEMAKEEMKPLSKKDRKPLEVKGRKYTATGGAFLVRLLPEDGDETKVVILLIGLNDLYLQGFNVGGVWFLLSDCAVPVPPSSQVFYGKTEVTDDAGEKYIFSGGFFLLPWNGSYTKLNGGRRQPFKFNAFQSAHAGLSNSRATVANQEHHSLERHVAFYAIGICECMRFWNVNFWVIAQSTNPLIREDVYPTEEIDTTIGSWGTSSTDCYGPDPPAWVRIIKRDLDEHAKLKPEFIYEKKDKPSKEVVARTKRTDGKKDEDDKPKVDTFLDEDVLKQVDDDDEEESNEQGMLFDEEVLKQVHDDDEESNEQDIRGTQDTNGACGRGTSNAIIRAPLMHPKPPDSGGPAKNTAVLSIPWSSDRFSTSDLMKRLPSRWPKPAWHAPWKNYRVISGHLGWVRTVAFDPGNERFCTGSADRTIKIWDLASGTLKLTLTGHIEQVRGLAASQRYPYLFSAGDDKELKCWDLERNKVIRSYHGLNGVCCLTQHPTRDVLLTGGRDSVCKVWDIRTKAHVSVLTGHDDTICSVFARPTNPQVVTGSRDATIKFWDLVAGKTMCTLTHHKKSVRAMALHPKEPSFASASADSIKKFSLPKGDFLHNMLSDQQTILNAMAVNEDGVLATAGDNGSIGFWDWKSGHNFQHEQSIVQPGTTTCTYAMSYDNSGSRLVTCEADRTVKMWKEDLTATPKTHPINFKPPEEIWRY